MPIFLTILLFTSVVLHSALGDLCLICECSRSDNIIDYNCDGKLDFSGNVMDLFIEYDPPDKLTLSNNKINETSLEQLKYLKNIKYLNISHNDLEHIDDDFFNKFPKVIELDLSFNKLSNFDIQILEKASALRKLDLSHNEIKNINGSLSPENLLEDLDFSYNSLNNIPEEFFQSFANLRSLNLSHNSFESFDNNISAENNLILLNLEHNSLKSVSIDAPNLEELYISHNELTSIPKNLSVSTLSIGHNKIPEITHDEELFSNLEYFNVSFNSLTIFPNFTFPELQELDVSYNKFVEIPENITTDNFPKLQTLLISGNPIKELKFLADLKLSNFVMKDSELLNAIYEDAFAKLQPWDEYCVNLTISLNKNLRSFDENALRGLKICYLDLSENGLSRISEKLESVWNGTLPEYGINLQGNPFNCDCRAEWMLKKLLPQISEVNRKLLIDLRCAKPLRLSNRRLAHWLQWEEEVFCEENVIENEYSRLEVFDGREEFINSRRQEVSLKSGSGMLFIIIGSAVSLLVLVVGGLVLSHKLALRRRRVNRRF